ncbi:MAG: hypothetical protein ABEK00_01905 [Candidatus Nanohaloarchaea archaeon]
MNLTGFLNDQKPYQVEGLSHDELEKVFQNAEEISRRHTPSLVYNSKPVIKLRRDDRESIQRKLEVAEELGTPETEILEQVGDYTTVAQERLTREEPDEEKLRDTARYIDQAIKHGTIPMSGLDDYLYSDGELLYIDATDIDSFNPVTRENLEGSLNSLSISAAANTELDQQEALEMINQEITDAKGSEVLKNLN